MTAGGDHLVSLPVLRALAKDRPVGMVHFDAHTDFYDRYFGDFTYTHGTPFRRAAEEGLLDTRRVVQIGIRGTAYDGEDVEWARAHGVAVVMIEELFDRGIDAIMDEALGSSARARPTSASTSTASTPPRRRAPARPRSAASAPTRPSAWSGGWPA
jgi:arginase family enzyme